MLWQSSGQECIVYANAKFVSIQFFSDFAEAKELTCTLRVASDGVCPFRNVYLVPLSQNIDSSKC